MAHYTVIKATSVGAALAKMQTISLQLDTDDSSLVKWYHAALLRLFSRFESWWWSKNKKTPLGKRGFFTFIAMFPSI